MRRVGMQARVPQQRHRARRQRDRQLEGVHAGAQSAGVVLGHAGHQIGVARERAALTWTEVLTHIPAHGVPDELYASVREQLSEKEISDLTFEIMAINGWNRANAAFRNVPGALDKAYGLDKAGLA